MSEFLRDITVLQDDPSLDKRLALWLDLVKEHEDVKDSYGNQIVSEDTDFITKQQISIVIRASFP